jgi:hypothetical protein
VILVSGKEKGQRYEPVGSYQRMQRIERICRTQILTLQLKKGV